LEDEEDGIAFAFAMASVQMAELLAVADEGEILHPKTTWVAGKIPESLFHPLLFH
jgi:uncharacterized protein (DUF1015 family)